MVIKPLTHCLVDGCQKGRQAIDESIFNWGIYAAFAVLL